ncbi:MAG: ribonuclease H-like domain-containing protein [Flavobacteriales bacterium]
MIRHIDPEQLLFLDIETVPQHRHYDELDEWGRELWEKKSKSFKEEGADAEELYGKAALFAEFGKIVCISVAFFHQEGGERHLRITSYAQESEGELLHAFADLLERSFKKGERLLCAHNGKNFDFPFIGRRMLINGITLPPPLRVAEMKPWEMPFFDTMELWRFGERGGTVSLDLLAYVLGIPSPKADIEGSEVGMLYWEEGDLDRIRTYCEKDVETLAQVLLRFRNEAILPEDRIRFIEQKEGGTT